MIISNDNDSLIFDMHIMMKMIPRYYHSIITQISIKYPNIKSQTNNILSRYFDKPQYCTLVTKIEISKALNCRSERFVGKREAESSLKREVDQLVDDEVKRFCQDDNNATVKGSNSVVFQNCSFVISKDLKFS